MNLVVYCIHQSDTYYHMIKNGWSESASKSGSELTTLIKEVEAKSSVHQLAAEPLVAAAPKFRM